MATKQVPIEALRFAADVEMGDNGENAKTVPVKVLARTGQPVSHWYWGRIVHDNEGMASKGRVTFDYCHDQCEVLGVANKFDVTDGNLVASGFLTPFKAEDRASEVIHKSKAGVPYEASIYFDENQFVAEAVPKGMSVSVNGQTLEGPLTVVRQWQLRGIAICPYGVDGGTAVQFSQSGRKVSVTTFSQEQNDMADQQPTDEKPAETTTETEVETEVESEMTFSSWLSSINVDEAKLSEADKKALEGAYASLTKQSDNPPPEETKAEDTSLSAKVVEPGTQGQQFLTEFGDQGGVWFAQGLTIEQARAKFTATLKAELDASRKEVSELKTKLSKFRGEPSPLSFSESGSGDEPPKPSADLENAIGAGAAKFAATIVLPHKRKK